MLRPALETLRRSELERVLDDWPTTARDDQLPPHVWAGADARQRGWHLWLILGGRGSGKTRAGAEWVRYQLRGRPPIAHQPARRIALVGPTYHEAAAVMVEGVSGLLAVMGRARPVFNKAARKLIFYNGAVAQLFSGEDPEELRGPQFDAAWCDELAKWRYPDHTLDMLQFGLRLGVDPRLVVTTTPRPIPVIKRLIASTDTVISGAPTRSNAAHLAKAFIARIEEKYKGTRLGRQELEGQLIDDDPDALFDRERIERLRVRSAPALQRIVVAVDPPARSSAKSAACGIIAAGLSEDGQAYVLADHTIAAASPTRWAGRAVALYHELAADRLVAEINQGGDMVESVIRQIDPAIAYRGLTARRGKHLRAEPVAALYEQERVRHVGAFPELEDEMCTLTPAGLPNGRSPDRVDALVWALTELMLRRVARPRVRQ
jgi:phage terminase large subunit-like protein